MPEWARPPLPMRWNRSGQPPFVGRRLELAAVDDIWSAVTEGAGGAVFVGGEPGAGKTRLVTETATTLYARGAAVLVGSCIAELGAPYEPFDAPIRAVTASWKHEKQTRNGGERARDEKWIELLANITGDNGANVVSAGSIVQRHLYEAVVAALRAASATMPLVVVLEDMQWAGATAVQLLAYIVERTTEVPILLLVTHRTSIADRSSSLTRAVAGLQRLDGVRRLDLKPLTMEEIAEFVSREAKVSRSQALASAEVLRDQSGGNAFFLRELWRDLQANGGITALNRGSFVAPESIRDALNARLGRLSAEQLSVLETAAVLGQEFDVVELRAVCDATTDTSIFVIDEALQTAAREGLLAFDGLFHFPHSIARRILLDRISPSRLTRLHARIAECLEEDFPAAPQLVQRLAHHYSSARSTSYSDRAVRYLIAAANLAERGFAHQDAVRLLERAAETTSDPGERDELRLRAARSCTLASDFARARALNEEVAALGDPRRKLRAAVGYEVASWRPGLLGHRAVQLLTEALGGVPADPTDRLYVRALAALARAAAFTGATQDAAELGDRAVTMARALDDEDLLAATLRTRVTQSLRPAHLGARLQQADELTAIALRSGDIENLGPAAYFRGAAHYIRGNGAGISAAERDLNHAANESGGGYWRYWAGSLRYGQQFASGRLDDAMDSCRELNEYQAAFGKDATDGPFGLQSYMVRRETGRLESVRRLITGDESPTRRWAPGLLALYTELRMAGPARRLLAWLLDQEEVTDHDSADWPAKLAFMVEAALWLEDTEAARCLRPLVGEYAGLNMMAGDFVAVFGSADRYLGALDSLTDSGSPEDSFASALALDERTGARLHQAQTLATHAEHLRHNHADAAAVRSLTERARSIAEAAGLTRILAVIELRKEPSPMQTMDHLTAREIEVLRLLGSGMSNREVADLLVISENTAANHVRNILVKIGSTNRTQAAIYASTHGLLD